jgi:hypothetical protein
MGPGKKVKLDEVQYYFDGVLRDALDSAAISRRSAEWLQIRSKLIYLDQDSYDIVMASIRSLVDSLSAPAEDRAKLPGWQESKALYGQIRKPTTSN